MTEDEAQAFATWFKQQDYFEGWVAIASDTIDKHGDSLGWAVHIHDTQRAEGQNCFEEAWFILNDPQDWNAVRDRLILRIDGAEILTYVREIARMSGADNPHFAGWILGARNFTKQWPQWRAIHHIPPSKP